MRIKIVRTQRRDHMCGEMQPLGVGFNIGDRTPCLAGQIWVINKLDARVSASGRITVDGKGLVLGGGDSAGRATGQSVLATLICQPTAPFTESRTSSAGVMLSPEGDFKINDMLSPLLPDVCISPMLLIRNAANLGWFAVGIFRSGNDD
jgi:hypothetical protein